MNCLIKLGWILLKRYFHIPIGEPSEANEYFAQARTLWFHIQTLHFMLSFLLEKILMMVTTNWTYDFTYLTCFLSSIFEFKISLIYRKLKISLFIPHIWEICIQIFTDPKIQCPNTSHLTLGNLIHAAIISNRWKILHS